MDPLQQLLDEILGGDSLNLSMAARVLTPKPGTAIAPITIKRWGVQGVRLADGRVVRLALARCGTRLLTSRAAIKRFMVELTTAHVVRELGESCGSPGPLDASNRRRGGRKKKSRSGVAT